MSVRRKAETLVEVIVAMAVFGVLLGGICDFITNQTANVAYIMKRDDIFFAVQIYQNRNETERRIINGVTVETILTETDTINLISASKGKDILKFSRKNE